MENKKSTNLAIAELNRKQTKLNEDAEKQKVKNLDSDFEDDSMAMSSMGGYVKAAGGIIMKDRIQSVLFDKELFDAKKSCEWMIANSLLPEEFSEKDSDIEFRIFNKPDETVRVSKELVKLAEGVKAVCYKTILPQTVIFNGKWSLETAKAWLKEHKLDYDSIELNYDTKQLIVEQFPLDDCKMETKNTKVVGNGIEYVFYSMKVKQQDAALLESKKASMLSKPKRFNFHAELNVMKGLESKGANEDFYVEGFASTGEIDRDDDIVEPKAFEKALSLFGENPILCYMHNWEDPIGTVTYTKIVKPGEVINGKKCETGGLYVKAYISKTATKIRQLIEEGVLKAFSIGFQIKDAVWDDEKEIRKITDIELYEISVVTIPSNRRSLFSVAKALAIGTDIICTTCDHDESKMCCSEVHEPEVNAASEKVRARLVEAKKTGKFKTFETADMEGVLKSFREATDVKVFDIVDEEKVFDKEVIKQEEIKAAEGFKLGVLRKNAYINRFLNTPAHEQKVLEQEYGYFEMSLYAKAIKAVLAEKGWSCTKIINVDWGENLARPKYAYLEVGRDTKEELLIDGTMQMKNDQDEKFSVDMYPTWTGWSVNFYYTEPMTSKILELAGELDKWVDANNWFKGEKINFRGQFLSLEDMSFDIVKLPEEQKQAIKLGAIEFFEKAEIYAKKNLPHKRGMIFTGEPGTGKTLTGKVIMNNCKSTFIWLTASDLEYGGTAAGMFKMARKLAPCVIFAEDVDDFVTSSHSVDSLKTEMDGMKSNDGIVTILCTNFPKNIPKALLDRPGRFDDVIKFELPDEKIRYEILDVHTKNIDIENKEEVLKSMASQTEGFSGAHLKELVTYSMLLAIDDNREEVKAADLIKALEKIKANVALITSIIESKTYKRASLVKSATCESKYKDFIGKTKQIKPEVTQPTQKTIRIPKDMLEEVVKIAVSKDEPDLKHLLNVVLYLEDLMDKGEHAATVNYCARELKNLVDEEDIDREDLQKRFDVIVEQFSASSRGHEGR